MKTCECGCGEAVAAESRFRRGHNARLRVRKSTAATAAVQKEWRQRHRTQWGEYARCSALKRLYGLSCTEYEWMLSEQGGVCAVCGGSNPSGHRLSVDHDHETGRVRGLLCHACNAGIGKLRDDPALLRAAADYIENDDGARTGRMSSGSAKE